MSKCIEDVQNDRPIDLQCHSQQSEYIRSSRLHFKPSIYKSSIIVHSTKYVHVLFRFTVCHPTLNRNHQKN